MDNTDEISTTFTRTYKIMKAFHDSFLSEGPKFDVNNMPGFHELFMNSTTFKEAIFYAGTGVYDYQYTNWVTEKYKLDKEWLYKNKGMELSLLPEFFKFVKDILHDKLNRRNKNTHLSDEEILDLFCIEQEVLLNKNKSFAPILEAFTVKLGEDVNKEFNNVGDHNTFLEKPIIQLLDGRLFIPQSFALAEAIYESPFYWMNQDRSYKATALKNRGEAAEYITERIIKGVYKEKDVYRGPKIIKTKGKVVTDIDVLAVNEDTAIVFQVKSKKLTALSKQGDLDALEKDFNLAIKSAIQQGVIAKDCILKPNGVQLVTKEGREVSFIKKIKYCEVVTVVLDNYPALNHQQRVLWAKGLNVEMPVSTSIFDLEIIAKYLSKPQLLFDYIYRRRKFSNYYVGENEMCYLGFHLRYGLSKRKESDFIYLDETWAQFIDRIYYPEVAGLKKQMSEKIGRNDTCPCGSGIKYKKCHGKPI